MAYQRREPHFQSKLEQETVSGQAAWSDRTLESHKRPFHWTMLIDSPQKLVALILAILFVFGVGLYMLIIPTTTEVKNTAIPLIQADENPIKILPENPGGIQVPHQDKLVYNRIDGRGSSDEITQLEREDTVDPASLEIASAQVEQTQDVVSAEPTSNYHVWPKASPPHLSAKLNQEKMQATSAPPMPTQPSSEEEQVLVQAPANMQAPVGDEIARLLEPNSMEEQEDRAQPLKVEKKLKAVAAPIGKLKDKRKDQNLVLAKKHRIQIASLSTQAAAELEKKRLWSKNKETLGKYKGMISEVPGAGGTYYKIFAGPFASSDAAKIFCKKFTKLNKSACFVVAPQKD